MKKEYKKGDRVLIIDEIYGHNFNQYDIVTIQTVEYQYNYRGTMFTIYLAEGNPNEFYWVWPKEIRDASFNKLILL